jgi:hypothetical protein
LFLPAGARIFVITGEAVTSRSSSYPILMGWWSEKCNHFTTAPRPTASRWRSALTWVRGYYSGQMARQAPAPPRIYGKRLGLIEGCLATVQIKPVSLQRHVEVLCHLYLSENVASPSLPTHFAPGARRSSAVALRIEGVLKSLGNYLQVLSPTTRLLSMQQLNYILWCGIAALPSLPLFPPPKLYCS